MSLEEEKEGQKCDHQQEESQENDRNVKLLCNYKTLKSCLRVSKERKRCIGSIMMRNKRCGAAALLGQIIYIIHVD